MGIGAFDTTHPLSMRMLGMHGTAFANYAVDDCDLLIAIGARFDDRVAGVPPKFAPNAKRDRCTSTSTRPRSTRSRPRDWCHVGRCRRCAGGAVGYGKRDVGFTVDFEPWQRELAELKSDLRA